jgi:hypothetical protein
MIIALVLLAPMAIAQDKTETAAFLLFNLEEFGASSEIQSYKNSTNPLIFNVYYKGTQLISTYQIAAVDNCLFETLISYIGTKDVYSVKFDFAKLRNIFVVPKDKSFFVRYIGDVGMCEVKKNSVYFDDFGYCSNSEKRSEFHIYVTDQDRVFAALEHMKSFCEIKLPKF